MERRSLIQILGAGLASGTVSGQDHHTHGSAKNTIASYTPRALTAAEYRTVDQLVEVILPADETSPGAHDAGVARYIDIVLLYGDKAVLNSWQSGVKAVDGAAQETYGSSFHAIKPDQRIAIVARMAANEANPTTQLERFFEPLKRLAIEAYYLSSAGKQSLGYKGDTAIARFVGCTHPEHGV